MKEHKPRVPLAVESEELWNMLDEIQASVEWGKMNIEDVSPVTFSATYKMLLAKIELLHPLVGEYMQAHGL
jgi:hypothetical protein